ncbi:MAG: phosphate ABC transporter substrate-binding protein [Treponema sp.]|nr:phosphate ABC transporter substrate-binding protein [Treponema sp.]
MKAFCSFTLILLTLLLFSCEKGKAKIIAGSTSVQPYVEVLAEEFMIMYPHYMIDIQGGGSSAGITAVESGAAQLGMTSRALKDSELHLWTAGIARDGLAMIINPGNPVNSLTLSQIRSIYTGDIQDWSALGGNNARIHIIAREEGSGTRSAFEDMVMDNLRITPKAIVQASNGTVRQLVAGDPYSIGFISLGLVDNTVKALQLDNIAATQENIQNGSYSLYREFLFVSKDKPEGAAMDFIEFIFSAEGQRIITQEGLITR